MARALHAWTVKSNKNLGLQPLRYVPRTRLERGISSFLRKYRLQDDGLIDVNTDKRVFCLVNSLEKRGLCPLPPPSGDAPLGKDRRGGVGGGGGGLSSRLGV